MFAPAARNHSAPRVHSASISADMPSSRYSLGMPMVRPLHRAADRRLVVGNGRVGAGRVLGVRPRHRAQHDRRVAHGARDRARLIERRGERDHAIARAAPIGRLDADRAGERGGLADRAAGVARGRREAELRGDRRGRAARGAAGRQQAALVAGERGARPSALQFGGSQGEATGP